MNWVYRVGIIIVTAVLSLMGTEIRGAEFPERPIQVLVGWPVGAVNDLMDRAISKPLSKILKQPVIIQNVPGASGSLVLGRVKSEKPDGYTLFQTGMAMYSQIPLTRAVPYDPLKDFAYLAQYSRFEAYLVSNPDRPWKNFEELIQYAKKNPKTIRYGTPGVGSTVHIMMEYLAIKENLQWIHVPYNSAAEAATALLGGHVDLGGLTIGLELEHVKTGRLRPLLCLNENRMMTLPDLPTVVEKGYDFTCKNSSTFSVPANTHKDIQKILEKALLQAMAEPEVIDTIHKCNLPYAPLGSEALTKAVFDDHEKYGELMKKLGLGIFKK